MLLRQCFLKGINVYKPYKKIFTENLKYINVPYLEKMYKIFNDKYFDGLLKTYPIKVKSLKNVGAKVVSRGVKNNISTWEIKEIVFSNQLIHTEEEVWGILLHEMIHVKLIENKIFGYKGGHDIHFNRELKNLQKYIKFEIPTEEDATYLQMNSDALKKKFYVAVILNTLTNITVLDFKLSDSMVSFLKNFSIEWLEKYKPIVIISDNIELQKYPILRKLKESNFKTYKIDKEIAEKIINEGKIIYRF